MHSSRPWREVTSTAVRRCRLTHQVDPGLKALGFQAVESTSLSKFWFQMCSTCTPTQRRPRRRLPLQVGQGGGGAVQVNTEEAREARELEKTFFNALLAVAANGLAPVLAVRRYRLTHQVDPGLKALGCQPVESTSLSKFWFQMSTCTPTARLRRRRPRATPRSLRW